MFDDLEMEGLRRKCLDAADKIIVLSTALRIAQSEIEEAHGHLQAWEAADDETPAAVVQALDNLDDTLAVIRAALAGGAEAKPCHFRAFGTMPCTKPEGHEGDHECGAESPASEPLAPEYTKSGRYSVATNWRPETLAAVVAEGHPAGWFSTGGMGEVKCCVCGTFVSEGVCVGPKACATCWLAAGGTRDSLWPPIPPRATHQPAERRGVDHIPVCPECDTRHAPDCATKRGGVRS